MGLPTGNKTTYHHFFVDNQVIIAQDKDDTEYKTQILTYKQQRWGLNVNILKTEYLIVGSVIQI
jgi:hypothetical protein